MGRRNLQIGIIFPRSPILSRNFFQVGPGLGPLSASFRLFRQQAPFYPITITLWGLHSCRDLFTITGLIFSYRLHFCHHMVFVKVKSCKNRNTREIFGLPKNNFSNTTFDFLTILNFFLLHSFAPFFEPICWLWDWLNLRKPKQFDLKIINFNFRIRPKILKYLRKRDIRFAFNSFLKKQKTVKKMTLTGSKKFF